MRMREYDAMATNITSGGDFEPITNIYTHKNNPLYGVPIEDASIFHVFMHFMNFVLSSIYAVLSSSLTNIIPQELEKMTSCLQMERS